MQFKTLIERADETVWMNILGRQAVRIIGALDKANAYNRSLRDLAVALYGESGLLLSNATRPMLLNLLRPAEARNLCDFLGLNSTNPFETLRFRKFSKNSLSTTRLLTFFDLPVPSPSDWATGTLASNQEVTPGYGLFKHQRRAVTEITRVLDSPPHRVLLHMPTGSGKTRTAMTYIAQHLLEYDPGVIVWLATSEELCEQAAEEFSHAWSYHGNRPVHVYRLWGNHSAHLHEITDGLAILGLQRAVRTLQRADTDLVLTLATKNSLVVMDEAHQAIAPSYQSVLEILFRAGRQNRLLGLSATPGRSWNNVASDAELADFFGRRKVGLTIEGYSNAIEYLVNEGYLAKVCYKRVSANTKLSGSDAALIERSMEIPNAILKKLGEDEARNLLIIAHAVELAKTHRRLMIFAPSVDSSNTLATVLRTRGYQAFSVTAETETDHRRAVIKQYRDSKSAGPHILCNFGVLTTGFDAPQTSAVLIARPTQSLILYSQMVGRAIRGPRAGGNPVAEVVTVVDTTLPGFGGVADAFSNWEDVWE